jgi:hypothetical protein
MKKKKNVKKKKIKMADGRLSLVVTKREREREKRREWRWLVANSVQRPLHGRTFPVWRKKEKEQNNTNV